MSLFLYLPYLFIPFFNPKSYINIIVVLIYFYGLRWPVQPTPGPTLPPGIKPPIDPVEPETKPGDGTGLSWGDGGIVDPNGEPVFEKVVGEAAVVPAGDGTGARAAGVAGAMIGALLLASSAMWAFYKFKPGRLGGSKPSISSAAAPLLSPNGESGVPKGTDLRDHFPALNAPKATGGVDGSDQRGMHSDSGVIITGGTGGTIQVCWRNVVCTATIRTTT